jgi:hypothetical protein
MFACSSIQQVEAIWARFEARGLLEECELVSSRLASIGDLLLTHSEQYALIFGSDAEARPRLPREYLQAYVLNVCVARCKGRVEQFM